MLTVEQNERLTQTGPGTPMGDLLRRYWWPIAASVDMDEDPVQPVRILGEDLTLFRSLKGEIGLIGKACAHRAISLAYGIPQENGLRCAYHGWTYNIEGKVVDMPFEPACLPLKVKAYQAQELGGLIWAYLGPVESTPLLPRLELLVRDDWNRSVTFRPLPCNWVQCNDNSLDPVHFEHLHGYFGDYWNRKHGIDRKVRTAKHLKIEFDVFDYGIYKRRLLEGDPIDADDWVVGHPFIFPHTLIQGVGDSYGLQIRVPVDDTHTMHVRYRGSPMDAGRRAADRCPGAAPRAPVRRLRARRVARCLTPGRGCLGGAGTPQRPHQGTPRHVGQGRHPLPQAPHGEHREGPAGRGPDVHHSGHGGKRPVHPRATRTGKRQDDYAVTTESVSASAETLSGPMSRNIGR